MFRLLLLFLSGGATLMLLALPALLRLLPPNSIFGVCVGAALKSPALWYEINQGAGRRMFRAGVVTIIFALGLYCIPGLSTGAYYASCAIVMMGMFVSGLVKTARHLNHYNHK
ncbi:MAG TPA: SdpI family protein [Blastocatellia bacterium]|nr:SdpI family protein [Blastocatellia bacterium]